MITTSAEDGIITPRKSRTDPSLGQEVLMALTGPDLRAFTRLEGIEGSECFHLDFFKLYRHRIRGKIFPVAGPFLGAPQAAMGLEKLIALGARRIWVLGWCGSLCPELRIGDLVVPVEGIPEEGTSQHYPAGEGGPRADPELTGLLTGALEGRGYHYKKGAVWSTDAPFRETPSKVKAYGEMGVLAVDMEMTALMSVALFRGVQLGGLLVVSDELFALKWHRGFHEPRFKGSLKLARGMLLELLERPSGLEKSFEVSL
ncbi:MAG: nucleoside phosphorylase [Deltaproteobacteria bacterium]|nr:nucleoside phosphorylase [Deltaproteobacteria bacterium]MBW2016736.1 nucleoside phosphorylase [Deltaproteobacteria bacterium]MBW2128841.1 nucleoside phosphorylase [Deltaproteobacteria bacterium]MBW2302220.1 nucleoside phosphorylase [Deltaproteobacteria bacterium]